MKESACAMIGTVGGWIAWCFGGWSASLTTLLIFMCIDYVTGLIVAGVFRRSPKTESGGLQSKVSWKGLFRKVVVLLLVMMSVRIDIVLNTTYIRDTVSIAFICNELISILENAGLMGIPLPNVLKNAIDLLQNKN